MKNPVLHFHITTIFPEFFESPLRTSLLGKAINRRLLSVNFYNPRDFAHTPHKHVDDVPFGGGPGMVMQAGPIAEAIASIPDPGRILLMGASGKPLTPELSASLAEEENITIICGRYEGIDARLQNILPLEEISFGETILNGGETAALAVIESVSRYIPGFMGKLESLAEETFTTGLLEYPQYTRPAMWNNQPVPEILRNGNHKEIATWRKSMSLEKTLRLRPELLDKAPLSEEDSMLLAKIYRKRIGRNLSFCLVHSPIRLKPDLTGTSSLTNLDIHDISRISRSYGMGPFFILTPLQDQLDLANSLIRHWTQGPGSHSNPDRARALTLAQTVSSFEALESRAREYYGMEPVFVATSASWPKRKAPLCYVDIGKICQTTPVIILLGTAGGLDLKALPVKFLNLRPLRFLDENHLSVRGAAAILADRILGDYN